MLHLARNLNTSLLLLAFRGIVVALACMVIAVSLRQAHSPSAVLGLVAIGLAGAALFGLLCGMLTFTGVCVPLYDLTDALSKPSPQPTHQGWSLLTSAVISALVQTPTPPPRCAVR
jgi:hypothetical protein